MIDTETPEVVAHDRPLPRARRRPPAPAQSASAVVVPVAGLLAFAGLVAIGVLVASRRRAPVASLLHSLPAMPRLPSMPQVPAIPHMSMPHLSMPHMPSFDMRWVGRLAVVTAAQAAISHVVQSALKAWK